MGAVEWAQYIKGRQDLCRNGFGSDKSLSFPEIASYGYPGIVVANVRTSVPPLFSRSLLLGEGSGGIKIRPPRLNKSLRRLNRVLVETRQSRTPLSELFPALSVISLTL